MEAVAAIGAWLVAGAQPVGGAIAATAGSQAALIGGGIAAASALSKTAGGGKIPGVNMPKTPSLLTGDYASTERERQLRRKKGRMATLLTDPGELMTLGSPNVRYPRLGD